MSRMLLLTLMHEHCCSLTNVGYISVSRRYQLAEFYTFEEYNMQATKDLQLHFSLCKLE